MARAAALRSESRDVEARNLLNLHEQAWALLPGFCTCPCTCPLHLDLYLCLHLWRRCFHVHVRQVWALLPGFCACARDAGSALPSVARPMGMAINDIPEARPHVLQALT